MDEHNLVEKAIKVWQSADSDRSQAGTGHLSPNMWCLSLLEVRHSIASKHLRGRLHIKR